MKMKPGYILPILFSTLFLLSRGNAHRHYEDDDFDPAEDIIPHMPYVEEFTKGLLDELNIPEEKRREIMAAKIPGAEATCNGCRLGYSIIKSMVNNTELEDVLDPLIRVCEVVLQRVEGFRGDLMCIGIMTYYGASTWEIFRSPDLLPMNAACEYFNLCDERQGILPQQHGETFKRDALKSARKTQSNRSQQAPYLPPKLPSGSKRDLSSAIKVAHLADIHMELEYLQGSAVDCDLPVCCRGDGNNNSGSAGFWGSYQCNIPPRTVEAMLQYLGQQNPDMIVYAGDSPPHTVWDETLESQLNYSRYMADSFRRNLPGVPAYSTVGNHETFPTSFFDPLNTLGKTILKEWGEAFGELGQFTQQQYDTLNDVGFYTIMSKHPKLRIISYNTNYGYNANGFNLVTKDRADYERMRKMVEDSLAAANSNNEKVILVGHHPAGMQSVIVPYSLWIVNLQRQYADTVVLHLSGHHHDDEFRLITDPDSGRAVAAMHSGPTMGTKSTHNPAMRVIYLDPDTYLPLDMDVFYLDVRETFMSKAQEAPIELEYRFTEEYGLEDMTVGSLEKLACRMEKYPDVFNQYYRNMKAQSRDDCSASCTKKRKCVTWHSDWYNNRDCAASNEYEANCRMDESEYTTTTTTQKTTTLGTSAGQVARSWNFLIVFTFGLSVLGFL